MKSVPKNDEQKVIIAYVPVLHEGYRRFFEKHSEARKLYLLDKGVVPGHKPFAKDIRALPTELIRDSLLAWKRFETIEILKTTKDLSALDVSSQKIIMPDEDIMHELAKKYLPGMKVSFDSIFLRWDKHKSFENRPVEADQTISIADVDNEIMALLRTEADKSSDFWRQIGAAILKDGKIILQTHNQHMPSEQQPYVDGDPRSDFSKGVNVELSTSAHAEASLIAEAARKGIALEGASLYATTFPCPPCAKMIAHSGIKKLYYADGYGVLDGERVLKSRGVEIVFVKKEPTL